MTEFSTAPQNRRRDVSDIVVDLLGVFRLAYLTGIILRDPYIFAWILFVSLGVFGNVEGQCHISAATRVALEKFKWCLWSCCNFYGPDSGCLFLAKY